MSAPLFNRVEGELTNPHGAESEDFQILQVIKPSEIKTTSAVRRLSDRYFEVSHSCRPGALPVLDDLFEGAEPDLIEHASILLPIEGIKGLDFQVLHRGKKMPGSSLQSFRFGERYSDFINAKYIRERLMEMATCLTLRKPRFSTALCARRSAEDVVIYRAVMPVWFPEHQTHAVVLATAPFV